MCSVAIGLLSKFGLGFNRDQEKILFILSTSLLLVGHNKYIILVILFTSGPILKGFQTVLKQSKHNASEKMTQGKLWEQTGGSADRSWIVKGGSWICFEFPIDRDGELRSLFQL